MRLLTLYLKKFSDYRTDLSSTIARDKISLNGPHDFLYFLSVYPMQLERKKNFFS